MRVSAELPVTARPHLVDPRDMAEVLDALDDGSLSISAISTAIVAQFCVDLDLLTEAVRARRAPALRKAA